MLLFRLLHCRSLSPLREFPPPATWGRHDHMLPPLPADLQLQDPQPLLLRLVHSPHSPGSCTIPWAPSSSSSIPPFIPPLPPSRTPALLKSAAIKTDAGLKCHKCISNCQNINLFTLRCIAFFRGEEGGEGAKIGCEGMTGAGAEEEDVAKGK